MANPFLTYAGVLQRNSHLVHMCLRNDPQVVGYQFWGQSSINGAYGNPVDSGVGGNGAAALFEVDRGGFYRSGRLRRKGLANIPENRNGTTQAAFDPDDFTFAGSVMTLPLDEQFLFMRVQENRNGVGLLDLAGDPADPVLGAIYMVPTVAAYGMPYPVFTTQATAPSDTGCVAGAPPIFDEDLTSAGPRPLYLVFPFPLTELTVRNFDGANTMLMSFGPGQPMMTLPAGSETQLFSGGTKEMILACPDAGGCSFGLHGIFGRS